MNNPSVNTNESSAGPSKRARVHAPIDEAKPTYDVAVDTIWCACHWINRLAREGYLAENRAKAITSATRSLLSTVMDPENPLQVRDTGQLLTIGWIKENLALIHRKFKNLKEIEGDTYSNYETKLLFLIEAYSSRCISPETFNPVAVFVEKRKESGSGVTEDEGMKTSKKRAARAPNQTVAQGTGGIQVPIAPQQMATIHLPVDVPLTPAHVITITAFLVGHVQMTLDDLRKLVGCIGPQMQGWDYNRSVADQLFPKN